MYVGTLSRKKNNKTNLAIINLCNFYIHYYVTYDYWEEGGLRVV